MKMQRLRRRQGHGCSSAESSFFGGCGFRPRPRRLLFEQYEPRRLLATHVLSTSLPTVVDEAGSALSFDGQDDYVAVPGAVLNGLSSVTTEFWLRTARTGQQALVSGANASNNNEYLIFLDSATTLEFYTGDTSQSFVSWEIPSVADNQWHHFAIVRDDTADLVSFHLDGVSQGAQSAFLTPLSVSTNGLVLGQDQDSVGGGFAPSEALQGQLDQVCIWNVAREAAEVQYGLTHPPAGSEPGLMSCWQFDDGTGTTAADRAGRHVAALGAGNLAYPPRWVVSDAPLTGVVSTGIAATIRAIDHFALNFTEPLSVSSATATSNYELREAGADGTIRAETPISLAGRGGRVPAAWPFTRRLANCTSKIDGALALARQSAI